MTTFLLIRHADTGAEGRILAGRMLGVPLNEQGRSLAESVAERIANAPVRAVYSSPIERARDTADSIAKRFNLELVEVAGFTEIDYGEWTGRELEDLENDQRWHRFNSFRSGVRIPAGELMVETQARVVAELEKLSRLHREQWVAVISHGDVIKTAIMHYAGIPLDLIARIEISPGSISIVTLSEYESRLMLLNHTGGIPV